MAKKTKNKSKTRQTNSGCYFSTSGTNPDYKEVLILRRFISDRGKVLSASKTGVCSKHQRMLSKEIKKARFMALLPYTERHAL